MAALLGLIDHAPDLCHPAVPRGAVLAVRSADGQVWEAGEPRPAPGPGPTRHGLVSLALALGASPTARALVACPRALRIDGDWDFAAGDVVDALEWIAARAGSAPLVLLLPWEWHEGPGDGSHPVAPSIARLAARPDTQLVAPTGNFGDRVALWNLGPLTDITWTPSGAQVLTLWGRGAGEKVTVNGHGIEGERRGAWTRWQLRSAAPLSVRVSGQPGSPLRLRPPFPSTGRLVCEPAAEPLGSVGFPACHPAVVAVGAEHWSSAAGLGGPDVLAPWAVPDPTRTAGPSDTLGAGMVRGTSVAAAVHAGRLLAAWRDPNPR